MLLDAHRPRRVPFSCTGFSFWTKLTTANRKRAPKIKQHGTGVCLAVPFIFRLRCGAPFAVLSAHRQAPLLPFMVMIDLPRL